MRGVGLPRSSNWSAPEAGADLPTPPTLPAPVTAGGSRAIFRHIARAGHVADSLRSYPVAERGLEREAWLTRTADGVGGPSVATSGWIRASHGHRDRHSSRSRSAVQLLGLAGTKPAIGCLITGRSLFDSGLISESTRRCVRHCLTFLFLLGSL